MDSYYLIFNTAGKVISGPDLEQAYNKYSVLDISTFLKETIKSRIYSKQNFDISISELQLIKPVFDKRIEELLKHPDFNPFKEKLREKFPEQYGSQPFEHKGTTYYLYHKGREFYIDSLIYSTLNFKELVEEHIKANKPLKYVFKQ